MEHKFKVNIGDWSGDGHSQNEQFIIESNHSVDELQKAYKKSCKLTGIQFNRNEDYTGLKPETYPHEEYDSRLVCTEYEESIISPLALKILKKFKVPLPEQDEEIEEEEKYYAEGPEKFLNILMNFIGLSLKGLEYQIVGEELPYLNGNWNKDLNVQFGYGLFN